MKRSLRRPTSTTSPWCSRASVNSATEPWMKRRHFLSVAAGGISAMTAAALHAQRAGTQKLDRIGLQLYTLRDMMKRSVPRTLDEVAKAGYREVEFAGYFSVKPR